MNSLKGSTLTASLIVCAFVYSGMAEANAPAKRSANPVLENSIEISPLKDQATRIEFNAVGRPSLLRIKGQGEGPQGSLVISSGKVNGTLTVDLSKLETGISLRDRHMKEKYLHTDKFPEAKLTLKDVALPAGWSTAKADASEMPFTGTLLLHGVEKPVTGTFTSKSGDSGKVSFEAKLDLKLSEFAIDVPTYAGITVADQVSVLVNVLAAQKQ